MLDRVLFRQSSGTFLLGLGCQSEYNLDDSLNWDALHAYLKQHQGKTLFTAINYQLGFPLLETKSKHRSTYALLRVWEPLCVYEITETSCRWVEGSQDENWYLLARDFWKQEQVSLQVSWKPRIDRKTYLKQVQALKQHIQLGNCYEINFCQQLCAEQVELANMDYIFQTLWKQNPTPFAGFIETRDWMLASASPERFIEKRGNTLISQPIKGTAPRRNDREEDQLEIQRLQNSRKERAENVMIVDLVRNDLSKVATKGSVQVPELCAIYSFPTVHQMISTVSCDLKENTTFVDIIQATFPMGSMTGAPKKSAVELADEHEDFAREWYSGSMGVIYPSGDFDLNVLIRTLVYNRANNELTCSVGGAITMLSDPEEEYRECQIKVGRIIELFGTCQW